MVMELYSDGSGTPSMLASSMTARQYRSVAFDALASESDTVT